MAKAKLLYLIAEDRAVLSHRLNLARTARDQGYDVHIATRTTGVEGALQDEGFTVHPLRHFRRGKSGNPLRDLRAILELRTLYKRIKPNIVHQVAMKPVLYGTIAARLAGVPHVINALGGMGYLFISPTLKAKLMRVVVKAGFKALLSHKSVRLILQNPDDQRTLKSVVKPEKVTLIKGAGVDTNLFTPKPEPKGPTTVVLVARLLWDKGIGELVEAARILKAKHVPIRILIVGDPDPENPASIPVTTVRAWEKAGLVEWLGLRHDIAKIYQESHIAVLPSYREGLPKSLLEAAACGKSLIATDVPGCREVVQDGKNGILVPAKESKGLAAAIKKLSESKSLREKYGKASRLRAENEFDADLINSETLALYIAA
ncbi:MAG: glycosyltransferase family 4 protein [Alphaproteobacteria bacterium]|nr:glycosyltransferase family 4 protein [Alphaproteobacteria bacterium]MBT5390391.1 glycosyltransferase family 4 protein [Alphaproteobacteria bacterium]MBT5654158.1 glycosyltransferase family 4 protein [Alphaproteobacteria bacterium]